ncbi:SusC/RagA family TonB-linked outer membrane protein [Bacteroidia bacterium]|nr:SusC/RagA family TonB-linked outer membrane protein [Bacteroidia bacterium]
MIKARVISRLKANLNETLKMMKITILFLFIGAGISSATESYSQSTPLSIHMENSKVKDVFHEIEKNSEYIFFYYDGVLDVNRKVNLRVKNQTVDKILDQLFDGTGNAYAIDDRQIFISAKESTVKIAETVQQTKTVTGVVTDNSQEPLIGVNVLIKGTSVGTVTDINGRFTLSTTQNDPVLVVSYIGYKPQEIKVGTRLSLNIVLQVDELELDEVIVVGYGTQKRSDLTGAISSVKASEIKNIAARSITEAMQGKVAGVMINKSNGKPGERADIIIRGVGSINGLNPLFIIDGIDRGNNVDYNPKDVESIEIIKDASAAAIYGSQAAGGVVLITTKQGKFDQKTKVDFTANYGVRQITKKYNMIGTEDYIRAHQAIGVDYPIWHANRDPSNPAINSSLPSTDWFNEVYQTGKEQSYLLSISGGSSKINYYISGGYEREDGIQLDNWERFSLRFNSKYQLTSNLSLKTTLYAAKVMQDPYTSMGYWRTLPYMNVYNEDGSFAPVVPGIEFSGGNPVADIAYHRYNKGNHFMNADLMLDWHIYDGLHLELTGASNLSSNFNDEWRHSDMLKRAPDTESYQKEVNYGEGYTFNGILRYSKVIADKHDVAALIGYEVKNGMSAGTKVRATGFPIDDPWAFSLSSNANKTASDGNNLNIYHSPFLSQFARLNYTFDNRYILTANVRRDGSPKFGPSHRFGVFPSASVGWKLSKESFFKNLDLSWVSMIKPRASYGVLGNDAALDNYMFQKSYKTLNRHSFNESTILQGYNSTKVVNKNIKWEEIRTLDVGLDAYLFANKLNATFDYYKRDTRDMIYKLSIPVSSGIGNPGNNPEQMPVNIGSIVNNGWEFSLSYRDQIGDFTYSVSGNISHNANRVIDLGLPTAYIYGGNASMAQGGQSQPFKTENGQPVGYIYGLKVERMFTSDEEVKELNRIAKEKYGANAYYQQALTTVGDFKYVDMNGDGRINNDDRTYLGDPWPTYMYGINLNLGWKGFDLGIDMYGVAGREVLNFMKPMERIFLQDFSATNKVFEASYFMGNGATAHPRIVTVNPANGALTRDPNYNYTWYSDYQVEDGSYFKVRNITVGYTLPRQIITKFRVNDLRIYLTGQNLLTFTKFTGLDPEFGDRDHKTYYGLYHEGGNYPQTKLFSVGLNIGF